MKLSNGAMSLETKVVASPKQISCDLADESVVLNLEEGIYYGLNAVASHVWGLVQQPRTIRELRASLLSEFEIDESICTRDLVDLVGQLQRWGLVELKNGNGSSPH